MGHTFSYTPNSRLASDDEVLSELRRIAERPPRLKYLSNRAYLSRGGRFSTTLLVTRFGSWRDALRRAGLPCEHRYRIPDDDFFKQIKAMWDEAGRQPTLADWHGKKRDISYPAYIRRFGTWGAALLQFTHWVNLQNNPNSKQKAPQQHPRAHPLKKKLTPRSPPIRLRYQVLQRDGYRCVACGRSPAIDRNVLLEVDHIKPWSKGGETILKNLRTLCKQCNLGKGDSA